MNLEMSLTLKCVEKNYILISSNGTKEDNNWEKQKYLPDINQNASDLLPFVNQNDGPRENRAI